MSSAAEAFSNATLYTDEALYVLVHLPAPAITVGAAVLAELGTAFSALVVDKDEVTLLLPQDGWDEFASRLPDHRVADMVFRLITFDLPLELTLVGFMALISQILAEAGISVLAISAFERDHVFVPADQFDKAWEVLRQAQR
jgi:hypothetical protein